MHRPTPPHETVTRLYITAIHTLCEMAEFYYCQGQLDKAQQVLRIASQLGEIGEVEYWGHLKIRLQLARVLIAGYFLTNKDADQMLSAILQAKQLAEAAHFEPGMADALSLLGQAHYYIALNGAITLSSSEADYSEALMYQQAALEKREAFHDTRGISESLFFVGLVHERQRQYDQAQEHYEKVLQLAGQHGHLFEKSEAARHLGGIAWYRGDLERALVSAQESLALREQISFKLYLPFAHILVGQISQARGDRDHAQSAYQQAFAIASEMGQKQTQAFSLLGLGEIQVAQKELPQARASFEHARALAEELQIARAITRANAYLERLDAQ